MVSLVGVVLLKMASLDLTPRLTRAWLEAQHLMNSYVETRAPEELDHLIYQLERPYRMLIVVECDTGLIETVAHVTNVLQGAQDSSVTCRGTEPLSRPLHRVDPEGIAARWAIAIQRRRYSVIMKSIRNKLSISYRSGSVALK